jgi:hypothetical protein
MFVLAAVASPGFSFVRGKDKEPVLNMIYEYGVNEAL